MTGSASPQSALPEGPTRQQLDELDALLKRMLSLPVRTSDEEHLLPSLPTIAPPLEAPLDSAVTSVPPPIDEAPDGSGSTPSAWEFAVPSLEKFHGDEPSESDSEAIQGRGLTLASAPLQAPPPLRDDRSSWLLLPVVWANELFDIATVPLGGLGRGLRGSVGRTLLGCLGFALIAAALLWLAFDLGLTLDLGPWNR